MRYEKIYEVIRLKLIRPILSGTITITGTPTEITIDNC